MLSRRHLLAGATLGATLLPVRRALAAAPASRKFVFVVNYGGWDPTRVFATEFDNASVDMERTAELATLGDLSFVDHEDRPSVRTFFETYGARSLVLNGVLVPSIAHDNCLRIMMTGSTSAMASDWPAAIASGRAEAFALPHLVLAGPSFPGPLGGVVTRSGSSGQLDGLLSGDILALSEMDAGRPASRAEELLDAWMQRRASAVASSATSPRRVALTSGYQTSLGRALELKSLQEIINWSTDGTFSAQTSLAVDALAAGVTRCVTVESGLSWDTHALNDIYQSASFEALFAGILALLRGLGGAPGTDGGATLLDETVVVVLSEMGRTPQLNGSDGKDHWPYTSVLMTGPGVAGGRVIGDFDRFYYGLPVDPTSGEVDEDAGELLSAETVGATLLALGDVDPGDFLTGVEALPAAIA